MTYLNGKISKTIRFDISQTNNSSLVLAVAVKDGNKDDYVAMASEFVQKLKITAKLLESKEITIEDYNGTIEITLFHEAWAKYEASMVVGKILGFQGTFSEYKGVMGFSAGVVFGDVTQIKDLRVSRIYIELIETDTSKNTARNIRSIAQENPGKTEIQFLIYKNADNYDSEDKDKLKPTRIAANSSFNVSVSDSLVSDILNCQGVVNVFFD